jgi:hypothetical protein
VTLKSQNDYRCPDCGQAWLPFSVGLQCPQCRRPVPDAEVSNIIPEALESARYNKRLYGRYELEYWTARTLGDRYFGWGFKAIQFAESNPSMSPGQVALAALMDLDLEELTPLRTHVLAFLELLVEHYRAALAANPADWEKMPEPEKPFFGRKIIDDE